MFTGWISSSTAPILRRAFQKITSELLPPSTRTHDTIASPILNLIINGSACETSTVAKSSSVKIISAETLGSVLLSSEILKTYCPREFDHKFLSSLLAAYLSYFLSFSSLSFLIKVTILRFLLDSLVCQSFAHRLDDHSLSFSRFVY